MAVSQNEYNVANQNRREINVIIQLLNKKFQEVEELSGVVVGEPSVTNSSNSGVRRTANLSLVVKDSSFEIKEDGKIWLDKYIRIIVEIKDILTKEYIPTNMGTYVLGNPSRSYDAITNTLTLDCYDLMSTLNGVRGGTLKKGVDHVIPIGESVKQSFIGILEENGFTKYVIDDIEQTVPQEIRIASTGTYYDLMYELVNIMPKYQMYFDVDGVFYYTSIPINSNVSPIADDSLIQSKIISYTESTNFEDIYNTVYVYGTTYDVGILYDPDVSVEPYDPQKWVRLNVAVTEVPEYQYIEALNHKVRLGFTLQEALTYDDDYDVFVQVSLFATDGSFDASTYTLYNADGSKTKPSDVIAGEYYIIEANEIGYIYIVSTLTPVGYAVDNDPDSLFNVDKLGELTLTLSGGEYDNITTIALAQERAEWELYNYTRLQESVSMVMIPIYWLDVNRVIELTLPNKNGEESLEQYIITQISTNIGVSGTQTIQMSRYYPFYIGG